MYNENQLKSMNFEEYKEIIKNGERVDWYGEMVPETLITNRVRMISVTMAEAVTEIEGELSDCRKGSKERSDKEGYLNNLRTTLRHLPYASNGLIDDCYMAKYKRIVVEIEKEKQSKTKPKTRKTRKPNVSTTKVVEKKQEEPTPVVKGRRGKNNNLIFGNK